MSDENLGDQPILLQNSWVLWYDPVKGITSDEYESNLHTISSFNTVQDFWACFNKLPLPATIKPKQMLHIMLEGIKPLWEDPKNETGGVWSIKIKKADAMDVWREVVLASIGEQFAPILEEGDEINGISLSMKPAEAIVQVWNRVAGESSSDKIWNKVKSLIPDIEITAHYYKACKSHDDFKK